MHKTGESTSHISSDANIENVFLWCVQLDSKPDIFGDE